MYSSCECLSYWGSRYFSFFGLVRKRESTVSKCGKISSKRTEYIQTYIKHKILAFLWFLDRHHVWRSHDPTSVHTFDFCGEKRIDTLLFLKKNNFLVVCIIFSFASFFLLLKRCNFFSFTSFSLSTQLSAHRLSAWWLSAWLFIRLSDASQSD